MSPPRLRVVGSCEEVECSKCHKILPANKENFYTSKYRDGTSCWRSACKDCYGVENRRNAADHSKRKVFSRIAPLRAAQKLICENPEAMALLIQRFRGEYTVYLEEERQALERSRLARVRRQNEINRLKRLAKV